MDTDKLKSFLNGFKSTVLYHQLHDCDSATFDLNPDQLVGNIRKQASSMELWINQTRMMFLGPNAESPPKKTFGCVDCIVTLSTTGMLFWSN